MAPLINNNLFMHHKTFSFIKEFQENILTLKLML